MVVLVIAPLPLLHLVEGSRLPLSGNGHLAVQARESLIWLLRRSLGISVSQPVPLSWGGMVTPRRHFVADTANRL